jgi:hypothetical protein
MLERKKKHGERNTIKETGMPAQKWKDWEQKEDGWM